MANYANDIKELIDKLGDIISSDEKWHGIGPMDQEEYGSIDIEKPLDNIIENTVEYWNESVQQVLENFREELSKYDDKTIQDAGYSFLNEPYVEQWKDGFDRTYLDARTDEIKSVLENEDNLDFTQVSSTTPVMGGEIISNLLTRLLMPQYSRRVEIEDLNRNFWVISQNLSLLNKLIIDAPWKDAIEGIISEITGLWDNVYRIWQAILYLAEKIPDNIVSQEQINELGGSVGKTQIKMKIQEGCLLSPMDWLWDVIKEKHGLGNTDMIHIQDMFYFGEYEELNGEKVLDAPPEWLAVKNNGNYVVTSEVLQEIPWLADENGKYQYYYSTEKTDNLREKITKVFFNAAEGEQHDENGIVFNQGEVDLSIVEEFYYNYYNGISFRLNQFSDFGDKYQFYSKVGNLELHFDQDYFPTLQNGVSYTIDNNVFYVDGVNNKVSFPGMILTKSSGEDSCILRIQLTNWTQSYIPGMNLECSGSGCLFDGHAYDYPHMGGIMKYSIGNDIASHYLAYDLLHPLSLNSEQAIIQFFGETYSSMEKGRMGETYYSLNKRLYKEIKNEENMFNTTSNMIGPLEIIKKKWDKRPLGQFLLETLQLNLKLCALTRGGYNIKYPTIWDKVPDKKSVNEDSFIRALYSIFNDLINKLVTVGEVGSWTIIEDQKWGIQLLKVFHDILETIKTNVAFNFNTSYDMNTIYTYFIAKGCNIELLKTYYNDLNNNDQNFLSKLEDFLEELFGLLKISGQVTKPSTGVYYLELNTPSVGYPLYYNTEEDRFALNENLDSFKEVLSTIICDNVEWSQAIFAQCPNPFLITSFTKELALYQYNFEYEDITYWEDRKGNPEENLWLLTMDFLPKGTFLYGQTYRMEEENLKTETFSLPIENTSSEELYNFLIKNGALISFRTDDNSYNNILNNREPGILTKYMYPFTELSGYWYFIVQGSYANDFLGGGPRIGQVMINYPIAHASYDDNHTLINDYKIQNFYDVSFSFNILPTLSEGYGDNKISDVISINQPVPVYSTQDIQPLNYSSEKEIQYPEFLYNGKKENKGFIIARNNNTNIVNPLIGMEQKFRITKDEILNERFVKYNTSKSDSDLEIVKNYLSEWYPENEINDDNKDQFSKYVSSLDQIFMAAEAKKNGNNINADYFETSGIKSPSYNNYVPVHYEGVGGLIPLYVADKIEWNNAKISDLFANEELTKGLGITLDFSNTYALDPQSSEIVCTPRVQRENKMTIPFLHSDYTDNLEPSSIY